MRTFDTNSVVNMTALPPGWIATFETNDGETWTEPVVALATVINWLETYAEPDDAKTDTRIEPVVIDSNSGYPVTLTDYLDDRQGVKFAGMQDATKPQMEGMEQ